MPFSHSCLFCPSGGRAGLRSDQLFLHQSVLQPVEEEVEVSRGERGGMVSARAQALRAQDESVAWQVVADGNSDGGHSLGGTGREPDLQQELPGTSVF